MPESLPPSGDSASSPQPREKLTLTTASPAFPIEAEELGNGDPVFLERVMRYVEDDVVKQDVLNLGHELKGDPAKRHEFLLISLSDSVSHAALSEGGIVLDGQHLESRDLSVTVFRDVTVVSAGRVASITKSATRADSEADTVNPSESFGKID